MEGRRERAVAQASGGPRKMKETKVTQATKVANGARTKNMGLAGLLFLFGLLSPFSLFSEVVHVYERASTGELLADRTLDTGRSYTTTAAPAKSGYIFTHWTISTAQAFSPRDAWGRAFDSASFKLYEETILTANYLPTSQDSDGDGVADGHELYWYGDLSKIAASDTDGDGFTFAQEMANGTNPLFAERHEDGPVAFADGALWQYNPYNIQPYTIRSEPEGALFATVTGYKRAGEQIESGTQGTQTTQGTGFAYWSLNGVEQRDVWGRAVDSISMAMPTNAIEFVAHAESDYDTRMSLYWYGSPAVSATADTDHDGRTFAEELAAGTNPLFPERHEDGPVAYADGALLQYNPYNLQPYTFRSEPEGALFATVSDYARAGSQLEFAKPSGNFAYWRSNGVELRDAWGRAVDSISLTMPTNAVEFVAVAESDYDTRMSLYWYGSPAVSASADTDNDGRTFAEELAAGTNPLFPERHEEGPVAFADTAEHEMNLQPYEQVLGAVVGGAYSQVFTSPVAGNAATSATFGNGGAVWPVVADLNDDGLWDLVVCWEGGVKVFVNVGTKGNPEFEAMSDGEGAAATSGVDLAMNSPEKLAGLSLDVPAPGDALSATTNGTALLVSDSEGRIWYYKGTQATEATQGTEPTAQSLSSLSFTLQHKVWGGSHAGFAQGLRLAAVDWDDDGDLDCLAGTADGKLMLLRNPKVGRPTNLKALAGVDNVLLTWDPNQQSRIRGYRVYRAEETQATEATEGTFARIAQPQLPTYRDFPGSGDEFAYKVSSVSRFYTAGNSTPTETESPATEAVTARLGSVRFFWNNAATKVGEQFEVMLSIENSMNYNVAGKTETVAYDPEYLTPVKVVKTGLTEECVIEESHYEQAGASPAGEWRITMGGGHAGPVTLPAGGGKFLSLVFEAKKEGVTTVGGATVSIAARSAIAPYQLGDVDGDGDVDVEDLRLLAKLKNGTGRKYTAGQLKAGDFNGNGKLDNADYQALRELLKEKGLLPGNG